MDSIANILLRERGCAPFCRGCRIQVPPQPWHFQSQCISSCGFRFLKKIILKANLYYRETCVLFYFGFSVSLNFRMSDLSRGQNFCVSIIVKLLPRHLDADRIVVFLPFLLVEALTRFSETINRAYWPKNRNYIYKKTTLNDEKSNQILSMVSLEYQKYFIFSDFWSFWR